MKKFFGNVLAVIIGNLLTFTFISIILGIFLVFSLATTWFESSEPKDGSVLEITFDEPVKESSMDDEVSLFGPPPGSSLYFRNIIRSIEAAKKDDKIKGISLKVENFSGGDRKSVV